MLDIVGHLVTVFKFRGGQLVQGPALQATFSVAAALAIALFILFMAGHILPEIRSTFF
jgi:hypothetical protein